MCRTIISFKTIECKEIIKAKGLKKSIINQTLNLEYYKRVLEFHCYRSTNTIKSKIYNYIQHR